MFIGVEGFLERVDGETHCAFWAQEPVNHYFDPDRLDAVGGRRAHLLSMTGRVSMIREPEKGTPAARLRLNGPEGIQ